MQRIRTDFLLSDTYRGEEFEVPVDGGRRGYQLRKVANFERVENRYLTLLGLLLTFGGLFGFIVEARMRSVKIIRG